eukprot:c20080_g1_i6.p1 GENE.c20080_g1_i6~~c20080_g1_i6.p1  ORF type:complete len:330 (+),score=93.15 c20080_g1_i6:191-1180(+)
MGMLTGRDCRFESLVVTQSHADLSPTSVTARDILDHVQASIQISHKFANADTISLAPSDGRNAQPTVSCVGGDAGMFVVALSALEQAMHGATLSDDQIGILLANYLLTMSRDSFGFQIDTAVLSALCRTIRFCHPVDSITSPPASIRKSLLELLILEKYQSNQLLHQFVQPAADDQSKPVRVALVQGFIREFFRLLWGQPSRNRLGVAALNLIQSRIRLVVTQGRSNEMAFVRIQTDACAPTHIPALIPEIGLNSISMHYDHVAQMNLLELRDFLMEQSVKYNFVAPGQEAEFGDTLLGAIHTVYNNAITSKLPDFSIDWPAECCAASI